MHKIALCGLGLMLAFSSIASAQEATIENIKSLLLEWAARDDLDVAALSPDGQQIVWTTSSELCLLTLETAEADCHALPDESRSEALPMVLPSPDELHTAIWPLSDSEFILQNADSETVWQFDEAAMRRGLPAWIDGPLDFIQIAWANDGAGLVVSLNTTDALYTHHTLYIDITSGQIIPFADFSAFSQADMIARDANNQLPIFQLPRAGVVTPEGDAYIALHTFTNNDYAAVMHWPLPPEEPPTQIAEITDYDAEFPPFVASVAEDGTIFVAGYLIRR